MRPSVSYLTIIWTLFCTPFISQIILSMGPLPNSIYNVLPAQKLKGCPHPARHFRYETTEGWNTPKYSLTQSLSLSNNPKILNKDFIFKDISDICEHVLFAILIHIFHKKNLFYSDFCVCDAVVGPVLSVLDRSQISMALDHWTLLQTFQVLPCSCSETSVGKGFQACGTDPC